jgi:hypothetical protein
VRAQFDPKSPDAILFEKSIADQLAFHKEYGGKIFAIGRIKSAPERMTVDPNAHFKTNTFCDINGLFLLDNPIHISQFNGFIMISRLSGITPVYGKEYDRLKEIITENNDVPDYFQNSYSTPFPHTLVNEENWMELGLEYRYSFTLEVQFRRKPSNMSTKHKKSLHFCRDGTSRDYSSTFKIKPLCSCSGIPVGQQMTREAALL